MAMSSESVCDDSRIVTLKIVRFHSAGMTLLCSVPSQRGQCGGFDSDFGCQPREFLNNGLVHIALERYDTAHDLADRYPLPGLEFDFVAGLRSEIDFAVVARE